MFGEQHASLVDQTLIKGERPGRRLQRCDLLLQRLQIGEVHRIVAEVEVRRQRLLFRREIGEHAEHLAGIAADRVDVEAVGNAAVPLRPVLPRRVPQEGIADRRIRDLDVGIDAEILAGDAVEDHAEGIQPSWSPW